MDYVDKALYLELHLKIKDYSNNDKALFQSMFPDTMLPTEAIRCHSSNWLDNMSFLYTFISLPTRDDQKRFKERLGKATSQQRAMYKNNANQLNSRDSKLGAIADIDGGDGIAARIGWGVNAGQRDESEERLATEQGTSDGANQGEDQGEDDSNLTAGQTEEDQHRAMPPRNERTFLRMLLTIPQIGRDNLMEKVAALFPRPRGLGKSMVPTSQIRFSSSDPFVAMAKLYDFCAATRDEQKRMKNDRSVVIQPGQLNAYSRCLTRPSTKRDTIANTANGPAIAAQVDWTEGDDKGQNEEYIEPIVALASATPIRMRLVEELS